MKYHYSGSIINRYTTPATSRLHTHYRRANERKVDANGVLHYDDNKQRILLMCTYMCVGVCVCYLRQGLLEWVQNTCGVLLLVGGNRVVATTTTRDYIWWLDGMEMCDIFGS